MGQVQEIPEKIEEGTSKVPNNRGGKIYCRHYKGYPETDEKPPSAVVYNFHGLFLHTGMDGIVDTCKTIACANRYYVIAFDMAGHGQSALDEDRGHLGDWRWFVDDALSVVKHTLNHSWPLIPFFFWGISLGGCIALTTALSLQEDKELSQYFGGAILMAPVIYDNVRPNEWVVDSLKVLNYLGGGSLALGPSANVDHFASQEIWEEFKKDKYCYSGRIKLSMGAALLAMTEYAQNSVQLVQFPFCLVHSVDDNIVKVEGSRELFNSAQSTDKSYQEYTNLGHNLLGSQEAIQYCLDWLKQRTQKNKEEPTTII